MYDAPGRRAGRPAGRRAASASSSTTSRTAAVPAWSSTRSSRESEGEWAYDEGCLSVPGLSWEIVRPKEIHLTGYDLDGNEVSIEADELLARAFQHELDHLDGVLLLERLDGDTRKQALRTIRNLMLDGGLRRRGPNEHLLVGRRCASSTSARRRWRCRRCGPWSTPATTSPSSCRGPTPAGGGERDAPRPVKAAALELGHPGHRRGRRRARPRPPADLGVVVAFGRLIKPHVLAALPMVNVHFSLLPRWRGAAPVERAILAGDDGDRRVRHGRRGGPRHRRRATRRRAAPIGPDETADELRARLVDGRHRPAGRTTLAVGAGRSARRRTASRPTPPRSTRPSWRSTGPGPPSSSTGSSASAAPGRPTGASGSRSGGRPIGRRRRRSSCVEVQPEGKGRMPFHDWANGARWRPGEPRPSADVRAGRPTMERPDVRRCAPMPAWSRSGCWSASTRGRLRQPRAAATARPVGPRRARPGASSPSWSTAPPGMRRALRPPRRPLPAPRPASPASAPRCASAPTSSTSWARRRTPRSPPPSRPCRRRKAEGFVNAVLRRVADAPVADDAGPTTPSG